MRKVTLVSTQSNVNTEVMTSATTWGQLKSEIPNLVNNDMKVTVRETRNDLVDDNAVLPTGDFILFLFPNKVKSGL